MLGVGLLVGPPLAGAVAGVVGLPGAFLGAAVLVALSAFLRPAAAKPGERLVP